MEVSEKEPQFPFNLRSVMCKVKQVSLQGRRMIGIDQELPEGYKGLVFHRTKEDGMIED